MLVKQRESKETFAKEILNLFEKDDSNWFTGRLEQNIIKAGQNIAGFWIFMIEIKDNLSPESNC